MDIGRVREVLEVTTVTRISRTPAFTADWLRSATAQTPSVPQAFVA